MTDIEITKLCAEAMDITHSWTATNVYFGTGAWNLETSVSYQPLYDDAQAMALVKRFGLATWREGAQWACRTDPRGCSDMPIIRDDLNRAICECVAKMQAGITNSSRTTPD